jgi:hypothetical protein
MVSIRNFALFALFILFFIAGVAMALPQLHAGMIDNDSIRDVGVLYSKPNFKGNSKFVFELKTKPTYSTVWAERTLTDVSQQRLRRVHQDLQRGRYMHVLHSIYTHSCDIETSADKVRARTVSPARTTSPSPSAPGDAAEVKTPKGNYFGHYRCGRAGRFGPANYIVKTERHEKSEDEGAVMGE